jgi:hypothetical protein
MSLYRLRIPALLVLAFPLFAHAQSLADVARQVRAQQQQSGAAHLKVYTNDDLVSHSSYAAENSNTGEDQGAPAEPSAEDASKAAGNKKTASGKSTASPERNTEAEMQTHTDEINQQYLGRIADLRAQIVTAQKTIEKLQQDQVESSFQFQRSSGTAPSIPEYQQQQTVLTEQMDAQRKSIADLISQLEDAQEAARHAGVPHATD